jgi:hypothetical protein
MKLGRLNVANYESNIRPWLHIAASNHTGMEEDDALRTCSRALPGTDPQLHNMSQTSHQAHVGKVRVGNGRFEYSVSGSLLLLRLFSLDNYLLILVLYSSDCRIKLANRVKFCSGTALLSM